MARQWRLPLLPRVGVAGLLLRWLGGRATRPSLRHYGVALLSSSAALLLALALEPHAASAPPLVFLAVVMLSTWYGGLGPGVVATVAGGASISYFFEEPRFQLVVGSLNTALDLLMFVLVAVLINVLHAHLQLAWRQAEAARAEAETAGRARDQVLAAITHDLKNPLTSIIGWTAVLQRAVAQQSNQGPVAAKHLDRPLAQIVAATRRMNGLVDDLLDGAQVEVGRPLALRLGPTDLVALARAAVAEYEYAAEHYRFRLHVSCAQLVGNWDGQRLARVLANLISNAVKYSPAGGEICVSVYSDLPFPARPCPSAVLVVRDQGHGIPEADLPRIFEPYFRASNAGPRAAGTGLGLATVREVVSQHGGTIHVESKVGGGTVVSVRLPICTATRQSEQNTQDVQDAGNARLAHHAANDRRRRVALDRAQQAVANG